MPHLSAAEDIISGHDGIRGHLADATCAAVQLVIDPASDDAEAQANEAWRFILSEALPHMDYEEEVLYQRAAARGVPAVCLDVLREEHDTLRRIAAHLAEDVLRERRLRGERAHLLLQFLELFAEHGAREEAVLSLFCGRMVEH